MKHAITIGNFDGVHRGHQSLIARVLEQSKIDSSHPLLLTFEPHPREFLGIRPIPERISSLEEKIRRIKSLGLEKILVQDFNTEFSNFSATDFLNWLEEKFNPSFIAVGENFFFGKNRSGSPDTLLHWGKNKNIKIEVIKPLRLEEDLISSTEIRRLIKEGSIEKANKLCGFNYKLDLLTQSGDQRGRKLGFPTLNAAIPQHKFSKLCLPPHGVYITQVQAEGSSFKSITNFGTRPTFHNAEDGEFFETHILSPWNERLSYRQITVEFFDRIRREQRFTQKEELIQRIQEDISIAKAFHSLK